MVITQSRVVGFEAVMGSRQSCQKKFFFTKMQTLGSKLSFDMLVDPEKSLNELYREKRKKIRKKIRKFTYFQNWWLHISWESCKTNNLS